MGRIRSLFEKFRPSAAGTGSSAGGGEKSRWVVAGLGNPGAEYARSRHNVGYRVAEALAREAGVELKTRKFKGLLAEARIAGEPVIIVKPLTYYNLSGECVAAVLGYFKVPPNRLIVVHDDLDLEPGRLRLKQGGGDAGNRGVRSIAATLGSPDFIRVRVGIGRPRPGAESKEHVLAPMSPREIEEFEAAIARAREAVEAIIHEGLERAMNRYNQRA
jgi:PTH1 family peptidyl-tRNA hydrolase